MQMQFKLSHSTTSQKCKVKLTMAGKNQKKMLELVDSLVVI